MLMLCCILIHNNEFRGNECVQIENDKKKPVDLKVNCLAILKV